MMSTAYEAGFDDAVTHQAHARLVLLQLAPLTNRELSDYWHGWHSGLKLRRDCEERREPKPADFVGSVNGTVWRVHE